MTVSQLQKALVKVPHEKALTSYKKPGLQALYRRTIGSPHSHKGHYCKKFSPRKCKSPARGKGGRTVCRKYTKSHCTAYSRGARKSPRKSPKKAAAKRKAIAAIKKV